MNKKVDSPMSVWIEDLPVSVKVNTVREMDRDVLKFTHGDCVATVGCGYTTENGERKLWATVYRIETSKEITLWTQAESLLKGLKHHYEKHGYDFGYSFVDHVVIDQAVRNANVKVREPAVAR